jgi:hypothetical protein
MRMLCERLVTVILPLGFVDMEFSRRFQRLARKYPVVADIRGTCIRICPRSMSVQGESLAKMVRSPRSLSLLCPMTVSPEINFNAKCSFKLLSRYNASYTRSYGIHY